MIAIRESVMKERMVIDNAERLNEDNGLVQGLTR